MQTKNKVKGTQTALLEWQINNVSMDKSVQTTIEENLEANKPPHISKDTFSQTTRQRKTKQKRSQTNSTVTCNKGVQVSTVTVEKLQRATENASVQTDDGYEEDTLCIKKYKTSGNSRTVTIDVREENVSTSEELNIIIRYDSSKLVVKQNTFAVRIENGSVVITETGNSL